ncbi:MAG: hypothetical protein ACT4PE_09935 [Candidatus Eiseniibacteriota bacterium]
MSLPRLIVPLAIAAYAAALLAAGGRIAVFEDEAIIVANAGERDPSEVLAGYFQAKAVLEHPPLYDLFLGAWIRAADPSPAMLRAPSILAWGVGVWLLGLCARRVLGRAWPTVLIALAWPPGPFFAVPAHWACFAFLTEAGLLWAWFTWRATGRPRDLTAAVAFGVAMLWTSWFGWAVVAALAAFALAGRPRPPLAPLGLALGVLVAAFLPLAPEFVRELGAGTDLARGPGAVLADAAYHGWALLAGEAVAPWTVPAILVAAGMAGLAAAAWRARAVRRPLALLGVLFAAGVVSGILNAKRLVIFAPFLLLSLGAIVEGTTRRRLALGSLAVVFGTAWIGALTGSWWGTWRYVEPWGEVVADAFARARPGDVVLCNHPSFWFRARFERGWTDWGRVLPEAAFDDGGIVCSPLVGWRDVVERRNHVIHVRTVVNPDRSEEQRLLEEHLAGEFTLSTPRRWIEDRASGLKNRFVGNQPRWRIEITEWTRGG